MPKFAACESQGVPWFKERSIWQDAHTGYIPKPGDIVFFDWSHDGRPQHVGIVERIEGEVVHTIEGNTSDMVARRSYRLDSADLLGYGTPVY
ncbi:MAG: CHAP domain-containing protein [Oscillospiraceae bacterium]|nr:CHAP domain-containing protein [Oscillospiraceae bacterium]